MGKSAAEGSNGKSSPVTPIATYNPQETNRGTDEFTLPYVAIKGADKDAARPQDSSNPHAVPRCSVLNTIGVYLLALGLRQSGFLTYFEKQRGTHA